MPTDTTKQQFDLRTTKGRKQEILDQIQQYGGFSIFWITENKLRACVGDQMQKSGEIITDNSKGFPWIAATITSSQSTSHEPYAH